MLPHCHAAGNLRSVDLACPPGQHVGIRLGLLHLGDGPGEVDRRRPGAHQRGRGEVEILTVPRSECVAERRCHTDGRRTADCEHANRLGNLGGRSALEIHHIAGQSPLVEDDHAVVHEPNDVFRGENSFQNDDPPMGCARWCEARTQGAPIPSQVWARPRTPHRAAGRGPTAACFVLKRVLRGSMPV